MRDIFVKCGFRVFFVSAFVYLLPIHQIVYADTQRPHYSFPNELVSVWDVTYVGVDVRDQAHWQYRKDDPRLLGRELTISAASLKFNDGSLDCVKPVWSSKSIPWKELIGESFKRSESHALPVHPSLSDFGISKRATQSIDVYFPGCEKTKNGRVPAPWNETWFAYGGKELVMRISTSALLLLKKRTGSDIPKPSFICSKSQSPTEKEICKSVALAALDRSVSSAWLLATEKTQGNLAKLREEQAQWLKERDTCADNATCIQDKMLERIEILIQE